MLQEELQTQKLVNFLTVVLMIAIAVRRWSVTVFFGIILFHTITMNAPVTIAVHQTAAKPRENTSKTAVPICAVPMEVFPTRAGGLLRGGSKGARF